MKGVELPINVIVLVVLALIVLLGILALFFGVWPQGSTGINLEGAKNGACQILISTNCGSPSSVNVKDFDADKDGTLNEVGPESSINAADCGKPGFKDNLAMLCLCWYGANEADCKTRVCGCP
jgi:hypothetical protein